MDAKGMMTPILLALVLACLVFPAKCEGAGVERSAAGSLRRRPDQEEMVGGESSSKIHIVLCFKTPCSGPPNNTCYCCQTLQGLCFWEQQVCWDECPNRQQRHQLALTAAPAAAPAAFFVGEPRYKSVA